MNVLVADIKGMLSAPLTQKLDLVHLFLLVGVVLVSISAWIIILGYIRAATIEVIE